MLISYHVFEALLCKKRVAKARIARSGTLGSRIGCLERPSWFKALESSGGLFLLKLLRSRGLRVQVANGC